MQDFNSTGQCYKQYIAKWASFLNSTIDGYPQLPSIVSPRVANPVTVRSPQSVSLRLQQNPEFELMKGRLDTLLREWKPRNFDMTKMGKLPSHAFRVRDMLAPNITGL